MASIVSATDFTIGVWDTHVHLFDPIGFPFKHDRVYTPGAARFEDLAKDSPARNFMVVQASVEKGIESILYHLQTLAKRYPERKFRGTLLLDANDLESTTLQWSPEKLDELHAAGVRCLRVHGKFGNFDSNSKGFTASLIHMLKDQIAPIINHRGWAISMQLPLHVWASLVFPLMNELTSIRVISEHCASLSCPLQDSQLGAFHTVCRMLQRGNFFVKLGALHRRADSNSLDELQSRVSAFAEHGPNQLLWGSDWPHVDSTCKGLGEADFLSVDVLEELDRLRRTMSDKTFCAMLRTTPETLFGL